MCQHKHRYRTSGFTSIMLSNMSRLSITSCLVFDLISFYGSYFVKECYYTLAVVDLQLFMTPSGGQNL